jgi:flagellar hook-associated protein 1 FlgK
MSDLLRIGASGVFAYRDALAVVGDNVANSETIGYSRRGVTMMESGAAHGVNPFYLYRAGAGGVNVSAITRAWDDFKASESRIGSSDAESADARLRWLSNVESALDDGDTGAGPKLTAFFNAADALAADPGGELPRRTLLFTLNDAVSTIRTTAGSLARASDGVASEARIAVGDINRDVDALARLNVSLINVTPGTGAEASLLDERDRLIDNIASKMGVEVTLGDKGVVTLTATGSTNTILVQGNQRATIDIAVASDGRIALNHEIGGVVSAFSPVRGELSGLIDVAQSIATRRQTFDGIAAQFASDLNTWSAAGLDQDGNAGTAMLSIGTGGAATLEVLTTDPRRIAAASATSANGNAIAMQDLRGDTGVEKRLASLVSSHAETVAAVRTEATATSTRRDTLLALRDSVTGVDLDREAADLLRYQQAYSAAARVVQVARETVQSILDIF